MWNEFMLKLSILFYFDFISNFADGTFSLLMLEEVRKEGTKHYLTGWNY